MSRWTTLLVLLALAFGLSHGLPLPLAATGVAMPANVSAVEAAVTLAPGDILALQADLLMKIDPVTAERTDYPDGIICSPKGLARAPNGELFATSNCPDPAPGAHGVYHIDPGTGAQALVSSNGLLAGSLYGIGVGATGDLFVAVDSESGLEGWITRIDPQTGAQSLVSSEFVTPFGIAITQDGDLIVTDLGENSVSRVNSNTGVKTILSQGGLLTGLSGAGGIAVGPTGEVFVAGVDYEPDMETGLVVRLDLSTGVQTLVSYGQLLQAGNTGITSIAIEPNGDLLVADRRSGFGLIRIDPSTGNQTGLDIGASPIDGIAVIPSVPQSYDLSGLFEPYGPPELKQFKAGSVIPLKWQYTRDGLVFNSAAYQPTVQVTGPVSCSLAILGTAVSIDFAGNSGLQYLQSTDTWQLNWKTVKGMNGCFDVGIVQPTLGVMKVFVVKIVD